MSVKNCENAFSSREHGGADSPQQPSSPDRRGFLKDGLNWIQFAFTVAVLYPLLRFLEYDVPKKPRLVKVHKQILPGGFFVEHDFVLFESEDKTWAVSRKCTHLGCRLNYIEKENLLVCPCHQSRFTRAGERVSGPARKNLPRFPVQKDVENNNRIYVVKLQ